MPKRRRQSHGSGSAEKKRKRRRRNNQLFPRARAIKMFPKTSLIELTYCDTVIVPTADDGISAPYIFRMNSIQDPDYTSTGHQPRGADQWANIYNKYCVVGAKVKVEPLVAGVTNIDTVMYGYLDDDASADLYSLEDIRELNIPGSRSKYVELGESQRGIRSYRNPNLNFKVGIKKFFGLSNKTQILAPAGIGQGDFPALNDPHGLSAPFGSNPTNQCYLKLYTTSVGTSVQSINCRVTIKYLVVCHDPKEVSAS